MIPQFPEFKNIEWSDKHDVEQITRAFPPYSDFNFVSLWSWDTRNKMKLSLLRGNLVILFSDYLTDMPFLSFIGSTCLPETACTLIDYSTQKFQDPCLRLIPECIAKVLPLECFEVLPDEAAHDYVLSTEYLTSLPRLPTNRHEAARYLKRYTECYPHHTVKTYSTGSIPASDCIGMFKRWAKLKGLDHRELNEYSAFVRFIGNSESENSIVAIYDNGEMIGFVAFEILYEGYAIGHFLKADNGFKGINEALCYNLAKELTKRKIVYWNFEQDLGIPQLRQAKRKYKPVFYLKKFTVQKLHP